MDYDDPEDLNKYDTEAAIKQPLDYIPTVPPAMRLSQEAEERVKAVLTAKQAAQLKSIGVNNFAYQRRVIEDMYERGYEFDIPAD